MTKRLLRGITAMLVYACVATVIAEGLVLGYLSQVWHLDRNRLMQIVAIAYGIDLLAMKEQAEQDLQPSTGDQPSFEQVLEARAAKSRNLELREQALQNGLAQLRNAQEKVADDKKQFGQLKEAFYVELEKLQKGTIAGGIDENRRILESLKPKQAKSLIAQMLADNKLREVVVLLTAMSESKRAKILGEFKTSEEVEKVGELLRCLREGEPVADKAENTRRKLDQAATSGS